MMDTGHYRGGGVGRIKGFMSQGGGHGFRLGGRNDEGGVGGERG